MYQKLVVLWALSMAFMSVSVGADHFVLIEQGQPKAGIVIASEASEQVREAVDVFVDFVEKSTGVRLTVHEGSTDQPALYVGIVPTGATGKFSIEGLDDDGFLMGAVNPRQYVIIGGSDWGTEFGLYDFLERYLGVRWLMPGEDGLVIPAHQTLEIPSEIICEEPVYYLSRTLSGALTTDGQGLEWARFHRIRFDRLARGHNLFRLFPVSELGKSDPDIYPVLSGRRYVPATDGHYDWQPDFSNPKSVKIAVQRIVEFFKENPKVSSYSIATNDTANFDESPKSKARRSGQRNVLGFEDASDDYYAWATQVVEQVLRVYPDKWFGAQAYRETLAPPTEIKSLPKRLVPHITYERMRWSDPALREFDQKLTREWAAVAPTLGWYDYTYGLSYQVPRVWFGLMQEYLAWGADHNVRSYHADYLPNWSGEGPKTWVMQKLLWNPYQDVNKLLDDWYVNAVGAKAAPYLREYYAIWEKFWTVDILNSAWNRGEGEDTGLYLPFQNPGYLLDIPETYIEQADRSMQSVLSLAETNGEKLRAERLNKMWQFYRSSVLSYQAEVVALTMAEESEADILKLLNHAENILQMSEHRKQLVTSFQAEDGHFWHFHARPLLTGATWGNSLVWRARPWITQSAAVRSRIESMQESENTRVRKLADMVLQAVDQKSEKLLENGSFEEGLNGWRANVHRTSPGQFVDYVKAAADGEFGVMAESVRRGLILQVVPYAEGNYYLRLQVGVPEEYTRGKVAVRFQIGGRTWRQRSYDRLSLELPGQEIPMSAGSWTTVEIPFSLPKDSGAQNLSMIIDVTEFPEGGQVFVDDVQLFRLNR